MKNWQWFVLVAVLSTLWLTLRGEPTRLESFIISVALLWFVLLEVMEKSRTRYDRHGIFLVIRTERGRELIHSLAAHRRLWLGAGNLIALVGIAGTLMMAGLLLLGFYFLAAKSVDLLQPKPVVPGYTIPFWYGIIGLITVLVVHELAHGVVATAERIRVKNLGIALLGVIPIGAFVEPDEQQLRRSTWLAQLRVYSAGSFANLLVALLATLALGFYASAIYEQGVQVVEVVEGSPAAQVLERGMVIKSIGNRAVSTASDFYEAVATLKPGERISIQTDRGTYELVTAARKDDPERGFIGIRISPKLKDQVQRYFGLALPLVIYYSLYWIALLNEAIGWINLAPLHLGIAATDGHHVLRLILEKLLPARSAGSVATYVSTLMVLILLVSIVKPGMVPGG